MHFPAARPDELDPAAGAVRHDEWVAPELCDALGALGAAALLARLDRVATAAAARHARRPVLAIGLDGVELRELPHVGERLTVTGRVCHTASRSMGVAVTMQVARTRTGQPRPVLRAYLTFIAPDDDGHPGLIRAYVPDSAEDVALYREGELRRQLQRELTDVRVAPPAPLVLFDAGADEGDALRDVLRAVGGRLAVGRAAGVRSADRARVHRIQPVRGPGQASTLFGWAEDCAALSAHAFVDGAVQLRGLHGLALLQPPHDDAVVHLEAHPVHTDPAMVTVFVTATAEDPRDGRSARLVRGFASYAASDTTTIVPAIARAVVDDELRGEASLRLDLLERLRSL